MGRASSAFLLLMLGLLLPNLRGASGQGFEYGEPIDITVTAGDSLAMSFGGSLASAIAVSFQQCTGDEYMRMEVSFNGTTTLLDTDVSTTRCLRVRGQGASLDDQAVYYDNLCAFQNSGSVGLGYETSEKILSSTYVDPDYITAEFTNTGTTTASGQVIMFSTEYPAPNLDEAIDRLNIVPVVDGNLFTIEAKFEAHGSETENFCAGATGCAMTIYYIEVDNEAGADQVYGTVCQARGGVLMYEGFTGTGSTFDDEEETDDENAEAEAEAEGGEETDDPVATAGTEGGERRSRALSTTAFEVAACVEFPKNTEARYRLYVVVSPDTESYAQVGYGVQDQLLYASDVISVDAADLSCPEVVEVVGEENSAAAAGRFSSSLTPVRASASVAAGLAAAAASMRTTEL